MFEVASDVHHGDRGKESHRGDKGDLEIPQRDDGQRWKQDGRGKVNPSPPFWELISAA